MNKGLERSHRWMLGAAALLALAVPMLSARRTAQGGMMLGVLMLVWLLPRTRRWPVIVAMVLSLPMVGYSLYQRGDELGGSMAQRILIDVKVDPLGDPRRTRFHELRTAWETLKHSPVFGLGPTGFFKVTDQTGLEYHGGVFDYVHSGFGHIFLKAGVVGLLLFTGILVSFAVQVRRGWSRLSGLPQAVSASCLVGLAAMLPTLLTGTPVTEIRTMMLMGLLMAAPLAAIRMQSAPQPVTAPQPVGRRRPARAALWPRGAG